MVLTADSPFQFLVFARTRGRDVVILICCCKISTFLCLELLAVICDYLTMDAITWKVQVKLGSECC